MICKAIKLLISSEKMHKFKLFQFEYYISYIPLWSSSFKGDQDSHDHPALFNSAFQVTEWSILVSMPECMLGYPFITKEKNKPKIWYFPP